MKPIHKLLAGAALALSATAAPAQYNAPQPPPGYDLIRTTAQEPAAPGYQHVVAELSDEALSVADKLCRAGRYGEAEYLLQKVLRLDPHNAAAREALVLICQQTGRPLYVLKPAAGIAVSGRTAESTPACPCARNAGQPCCCCQNGVCAVRRVEVRTDYAPVTVYSAYVVGQAKDRHGPVCRVAPACCCQNGGGQGQCCCATRSPAAQGCCCAGKCCCGEGCTCANPGNVAPNTVYRVLTSMPRGIPCCTVAADGKVIIGKPTVAAGAAPTQIYIVNVPGPEGPPAPRQESRQFRLEPAHPQRLETVQYHTPQAQPAAQPQVIYVTGTGASSQGGAIGAAKVAVFHAPTHSPHGTAKGFSGVAPAQPQVIYYRD